MFQFEAMAQAAAATQGGMLSRPCGPPGGHPGGKSAPPPGMDQPPGKNPRSLFFVRFSLVSPLCSFYKGHVLAVISRFVYVGR